MSSKKLSSLEVNINFMSFNKTFRAKEKMEGYVSVKNNGSVIDLSKILLTITGSFSIKTSSSEGSNLNIIKFFQRKYQVLNQNLCLAGNNQYDFKLPLEAEEGSSANNLYESYTGVSVSVYYDIVAEVISSKGYQNSEPMKIIVLVPGSGIDQDIEKTEVPYFVEVTQSSLDKPKISLEVPDFNFLIKIDNTNCNIDEPLMGYINIKKCSVPIKSIELQFVRNESVKTPNGDFTSDISEVQNLQIGDGEVLYDSEIPTYMIFPRIFSCTTLTTNLVRLSFEVNIY